MDMEGFLQQLNDQGIFLLDGQRLMRRNKLDQLLFSEDEKDKDNLKTIIITAATNDNHRIVTHLLRQGYQVDVLNDKNQTLTHLAYYNDTHLILQHSEGLVFSSCKNYSNYIDCDGLSHLHIACATGYVDAVKQFLDNGEDIHACLTVNCNGDKAGFTSLHFAVAHHQIEVIKLLLERGADINAADSSGMTPLHLICAVSTDFQKFRDTESLIKSTSWAAELDVLKLLLERNCNVNPRDGSGNTPLFSIFKNDYYYYPYYPLKADERLARNVCDREDLANLFCKRQLEKPKVLLDNGSDIIVKNHIGESILHRVVEDLTYKRFSVMPLKKCVLDKAYADHIRWLLETNEELDVDAKNAKGETPISLAVSLMSHEIVKVLLDHNADLSSIKIDGHHFFRHPKVILSMQMMNSLKMTIYALQSKGFKLNLGDQLTIMKFLAHDVDDCDCGVGDDVELLLVVVSQFFYYGSSAHLKRVLAKVCDSTDDTSRTKLLSCIQLFVEYSKLISYPIHVDEKVLEILQKDADVNNFPLVKGQLQVWKEDVSFMKSTTIVGDLSAYDFVTKCPRLANILVYRKSDIKQIRVDQFHERPTNKMVIVGHWAKLTLRMYIESSALKNYVNFVLPLLPNLCHKMILECLDIEDILRLCEASLLD